MATVFGLKDNDLKKFAKYLKLFAKEDYPAINGRSLNQIAFETRKEAVRIAEIRFTLRNRWTIKSIQFEKVKGFNPSQQFSVVGSTMDYMRQQEFGATIKKTGAKGIAIPTTTASGEPFGAKPRKKRIMRSRYRSSIKLSKSSIKAKNRKQHIFLSIREASEKGSGKYVYLPIQNAKGIYRVTGKGTKAKIKMIYDLSKGSVQLDKKPWLNPAVTNIIPKMPVIYKKIAEEKVGKRFKF